MVMQQGGTNGAGPYTCDMDQTSNAQASGQTKLTVKETDGTDGNIKLAVTMPSNMSCIGGMYFVPVSFPLCLYIHNPRSLATK